MYELFFRAAFAHDSSQASKVVCTCYGHPQFASNDDPFLPISEQLEVAEGLKSELHRCVLYIFFCAPVQVVVAKAAATLRAMKIPSCPWMRGG